MLNSVQNTPAKECINIQIVIVYHTDMYVMVTRIIGKGMMKLVVAIGLA